MGVAAQPGDFIFSAQAMVRRARYNGFDRSALIARLKPISFAPHDVRTVVLFDGVTLTYGHLWKHWSMPEPVWWSPEFGVFEATHFYDSGCL